MSKYLDGVGLSTLCEKINTNFLRSNVFSLVRDFTTTAGTNTLTLPSDFLSQDQYSSMAVYLDGIKLVRDTDFTFNSTTRVLTFVDTFISGDIVTVGLYTSNYEPATEDNLPAQSVGVLTSDGTSMSWKNFTKMVYTQDTTSANETVTIPQANLTDAIVTEVFRNGLLMVETDDYTINSSTREITFVVPLAANEKIVVITQKAITPSGTLISGATLQNSTANTPQTNDNSTNVATTAYVKSNLANYVDLSTNQSLDGNKTMSGTLSAKYVDIGYSGDIETSLVQLNIGHPSRFSNLGDLPSSASYSGIYFTDHSGKTYGSNVIGMIEHSVSTSGTSSLYMRALKNVSSGNTTTANICELKVSIDSAGNKVTAAPTPTTSDNSTQIATTAYVNNKFANPIEKVNAITSAASITIDPNTGSLFTLTLGVNSSITIGNLSGGPYATNGATITLYLTNTNKTISWNSKITWVSGEAPDVTSNPSIITFVTFNGGAKWYGSSIEVES